MRFDRLRRDLRFGLRTHAGTPVITLVIITTLALGIAASTLTFSLVNGLFLRPPPIREPERFVRVYHQANNSTQFLPVSYPEFDDLGEMRDVFDGGVLEEPLPLRVGTAAWSVRAFGERVSDGYSRCWACAPLCRRGRGLPSHKRSWTKPRLMRPIVPRGSRAISINSSPSPRIAAVAGVNPARITNGAPSIGSSGTPGLNAATDLKLLLSTFFSLNPNAASVAILFSPATATALSIATNSQTCGPNGGTLMGVPIITGSVGNKLIAVDPSQVLMADDGRST